MGREPRCVALARAMAGALSVANGVYAIERHTIHLVVSGRDVASPAGSTSSSPPIIFADPDFDLDVRRTIDRSKLGGSFSPDSSAQGKKAAASGSTQRRYTFAKLDYSGPEAEGIRGPLRQFAGAEPVVHIGAEATELNFHKVRRPRVLVLSTHGFFGEPADALASGVLTGSPLLRCGLVLAGANHGGDTDAAAIGQSGDDGVLTGLEIVGTDLNGTGLVVLSACETGMGQIQSGEGVAGPARPFSSLEPKQSWRHSGAFPTVHRRSS